MPRPLIFHAFLLPLLVVSSPWAAPPPTSAGSGVAHWVPLSAAVSDGDVRAELFSEREREAIAGWLVPRSAEESATSKNEQLSHGACDVLVVTSTEIPASSPCGTWSETTYLVLGVVTGIEAGLHHGRLASLLTVEVETWLKRDPVLPALDEVYVVLPEGRAEIGGKLYCAEGPNETRLTVGQEILFGADQLLDPGAGVFYPRTKDVVLEQGAGAVSVGGRLPEELVHSWQALREQVLGRGSSRCFGHWSLPEPL